MAARGRASGRPPRIGLLASDAIALAQFSLARAADAVAADTGLPVLTTPDSAVRLLRARLGISAASG